MNDTTLKLLTNSELVAIRGAWEERLCELDKAPVYLEGIARDGNTDMAVDPERRVEEALDELAEHVGKLRDAEVFRPLNVRAALYGVHFSDKIFGADVFELDGERGNWQVRKLSTPVGALERPDLTRNATWQTAQEFARAFVGTGVTVAVFQLPTIASALNVAINLYGQEFLVAMMLDPDAAHRDLDVINSVLIEIHDWYRANVPVDLLHQVALNGRYQPPGCGQICGCSTQLVSGEQYAECIAAHDDAVLSRYPNGGMIHLCGSHTQHCDTWRDMKSLTAIQVNDRAAEDIEVYVREMPDKIYYVHPCEGMPLKRVEDLAMDHKIVICSAPSH